MSNDQILQYSKEPLLKLRDITKHFSSNIANNHIDLDVFAGEIHALLGENGAGKSVLMKILYGFYRADTGNIFMDGKPVDIRSPYDARNLKIGMVFQNRNLIPVMPVWENIALFLQDLPTIINKKEIQNRIIEKSKKYGLNIDPYKLVSQISMGDQQKVEILKLLISDARVLILDEPTHVLAPHEIEAFFTILKELRKDGYAIILITHKMKDVLACSDRISVLRNGCKTGTILREEADETKLIELMFGQKITEVQNIHRPNNQNDKPYLELKNISNKPEDSEIKLKNIDLKIYPGEIVGVAGVSGNGQKELCDVILGMSKSSEGEKFLGGVKKTNASVGKIRQSGTAFVPENALTMATIPFLTVAENMVLTKTKYYSKYKGLAIDWDKLQSDMEKAEKRFDLVVPLNAIAQTLSGGNLQRMVILRELEDNPKLIIASYVTRGLDVKTAISARRALVDAKNNGAAVLMVSEDLDELFEISDRIIVLFEGKIVGDFPPDETDVYTIGHLMTGSGC